MESVNDAVVNEFHESVSFLGRYDGRIGKQGQTTSFQVTEVFSRHKKRAIRHHDRDGQSGR